MKDLAGRRTVIAASVAPQAHMRATRTLATAGSRVRQLEQRLQRQITAREVDGLILDEVTHQFAALLDLIGDHQCLGDELRQQLELLAALLGIARAS